MNLPTDNPDLFYVSQETNSESREDESSVPLILGNESSTFSSQDFPSDQRSSGQDLDDGEPTSRPSINYRQIESTHSLKSLITQNFWKYYFDIDSLDFVQRLVQSFIPHTQSLYPRIAETKPDLYAPFWIATTLVFISTLMGNCVSFTNYLLSKEKKEGWFFDFHMLGVAAPIFYIFVFIIPLIVGFVCFFAKKCSKKSGEIVTNEQSASDIEANVHVPLVKNEKIPQMSIYRLLFTLICIYGYCLSPFLILLFFLIIPFIAAQWIVIIIASVYSFVTTFLNIKDLVYAYLPHLWFISVAIILFLVHTALALCLGFFF